MSKEHKTQLLIEDVGGVEITPVEEIYHTDEYIRDVLIMTPRGVVRVVMCANDPKKLLLVSKKGVK